MGKPFHQRRCSVKVGGMNISELREKVRGLKRRAYPDLQRIVVHREEMWYASIRGVGLDNSRGLLIMVADPREDHPWAEHVRGHQLKTDVQRVMVLATGAEQRSLAREECQTIHALCAERGIGNPKIVFCCYTSEFWSVFFATERFMSRRGSIPSLMVSTGQLRGHDGHMPGTVHIEQILADISCQWGVPLVMIPPRI